MISNERSYSCARSQFQLMKTWSVEPLRARELHRVSLSYLGCRLSWRIVRWPRPSSGRGRSDGTGPPVRSGRRRRP